MYLATDFPLLQEGLFISLHHPLDASAISYTGILLPFSYLCPRDWDPMDLPIWSHRMAKSSGLPPGLFWLVLWYHFVFSVSYSHGPWMSCMCQADYRQDALNNIASCVNSGCDTTSEQSEAPKIFNTFCGGPVPSSVSVFPNTIGTLLWTEKIVKILSSSVSAGPNTTGTLLWTEKIVKISQTGTPGSTKTGTAQRGIALSWNTLTMLIVSLGAVIIWGWMAV